MGRTFVASSSQYLNNDHGVSLSESPVTFCAWFRVSSLPASLQTILSCVRVNATASNNQMGIGLNSSGNIEADVEEKSSPTTTAASTNVWQHALGLITSNVSRKSYLNGGGVAESTTARGGNTMDELAIGCRLLSAGADQFFDGDIGEWALWDVAITLDEIEALAGGASPLLIQPKNIICYGQGFGTSNQPLVIGPTMTDNGTVTDAGSHPPVFLPTQPFAPTPAAGGATFTATAAITTGGVAVSAAGTSTVPIYTATSAIALSGVAVAAAGTSIVPVYTAACAIATGSIVVAASGVFSTEPALPIVTPGTLPPVGWDGTADVVITDSDNLQTTIDNADVSSGMYIIELTAGDTWTDKFIIDNSVATGANWLILRTSNFANLPADGNRLQPSPTNDGDMAILVGKGSSPYENMGIEASTGGAGGAAKVALIGLEFRPSSNGDPANMLTVGRVNQDHPTTTSDFCDDITIYQCRFKGGVSGLNPVYNGQAHYGTNNTIISCNDHKVQGYTSADGSAAMRIIAANAMRIYNNGCETESVPIFISDSNAPTHGAVPTDVTIDHNYCWRDIALRPGYHKNCFEIKAGERLLIENNIFHTSWKGAGAQWGYGCVIKNVHTQTFDVTYRYNIVHDVNQGYFIQGENTSTGLMRRVSMHDNLFYNIDALYSTGGTGDNRNARAGESTGVSHDVKVFSNTFVCSDGKGLNNLHAGMGQSERQIWRDNITANTTSGAEFDYFAFGGRDNVDALNFACNEYTLEYSAMMGADINDYDDSGDVDSGSVIDNNFFPTAQSEYNFVDAGSDDYRIQSGSYLTASSTGGVLGADIDEINTRTEKVVTGTIFTPTYTATAAIAVSSVAIAASGMSATSLHFGTAAIVVGSTVVSATGTFVTIHSATAAVAVGSIAVAAAGTSTVPVYAATAAITVGSTVVAASGVFVTVLFEATSAITVGIIAVSAAGTSVVPVYSATSAIIVGTVAVMAAGTSVVPVYLGQAVITIGSIAVAAAGTFATIHTASAVVAVGSVVVASSGTLAVPVYTATSVAISVGSIVVSASGTQGTPREHFATASIVIGGVDITAVAHSIPPLTGSPILETLDVVPFFETIVVDAVAEFK